MPFKISFTKLYLPYEKGYWKRFFPLIPEGWKIFFQHCLNSTIYKLKENDVILVRIITKGKDKITGKRFSVSHHRFVNNVDILIPNNPKEVKKKMFKFFKRTCIHKKKKHLYAGILWKINYFDHKNKVFSLLIIYHCKILINLCTFSIIKLFILVYK